MKIFYLTFGCKVNQYETECLKTLFAKNNYSETNTEQNADIFVINSCTVTAHSSSKVMRRLASLRKNCPQAVLVLTGCFPQAFPEIFTDNSGSPVADIISGTKSRGKLPELVEQFLSTQKPIIDIDIYNGDEKFESFANFANLEQNTHRTRAFLKIQDGCNRHCAYCIIPKARGDVRSEPLELVLEKAEKLAKIGYKEIVLTGINLGLYSDGLGEVVRKCADIAGIERMRLGSIEPDTIIPELIETLKVVKEFCPHFHISLQSGSDRILHLMNRRYTTAEYASLLENLRSTFPDCTFTTDVIVGFPHETNEDFTETMEFVRNCKFKKIHVFPYSKRSGTPATDFPCQVPEHTKKARTDMLLKLSDKLASNVASEQIGKAFPVLFETNKGHAPNYFAVRVSGTAPPPNTIATVLITGVSDDAMQNEVLLLGEVVS